MPTVTVDIRAVDPLALILPTELYLKLHAPDPPPMEQIIKRLEPVLGQLSEAERREVARRKVLLQTHLNAVDQVLGPK